MFQPYGLVVEVAKVPEQKHKLAVMYDESLFSEDRAREIAEEIKELVVAFVENSQGGSCVLSDL